MATIIDLTGMTRTYKKFQKLQHFDASPLMVTWEQIIEEDNRKGIMAGEDKDGGYMLAVRYRPKAKNLINIRKNNNESRRMRNGSKAGVKRGRLSMRGPAAAGWNNNLIRAEYVALSGPPLAPRGIFSRSITNFVTSNFADASRRLWTVVAGWAGVVSVTGYKFLGAHFNGSGNLPMRDLRGVRPRGKERMRKAAFNWMKDTIRAIGESK